MQRMESMKARVYAAWQGMVEDQKQSKWNIRKVINSFERGKQRRAFEKWRLSLHNFKIFEIETRISRLKNSSGDNQEQIKSLETEID